jgi:molybdate transport system ATP-binding protein
VIEAAFRGRLGAFRLQAELTLPAAGVTAIVGPSGCGKTTLLRCIAGLTRLDGRLIVNGEAWQDGRAFLPPHRRAVGFVFQEASLLPHLSVRENLLFGFRRARVQTRIAVDEVTALLGVEPLLERPPGRLSGGERQRVAIGRALLSQPELLLMDEPLAGLDADSKAEITPYLGRLHRALAIPILYVSHDPAEVARLAQRLIRMEEGRVLGEAEDARDLERRLDGLAPYQVLDLARAALRAGLAPETGE